MTKSSREAMLEMMDQTKWSREFSWEELQIMVRYMSITHYEKGEEIFKESSINDYMAFIAEGKVDIIKHSRDTRERVVITISRGLHFGEMALLDGEPRSASAKAATDVTLLVLSRTNFDQLVEDYPAMGVKMLRSVGRMISRRLRMTTGQLVFLADR